MHERPLIHAIPRLAPFYWGSECTVYAKGDINENNIPLNIKVTIYESIKNFRGAEIFSYCCRFGGPGRVGHSYDPHLLTYASASR